MSEPVTAQPDTERPVRRRGELEHLVLQLLWDSPTPLTARAVQDELAGQRPAITTVLTVLDRLRCKHLVQRHEGGGTAMTFTPSQSQSDHAVQAMLTSLTTTSDRRAALLQFAGDLDDVDADILRDALTAQRHRQNR